jgi:spore coat polysaccharide biosynthesis protein SpsF (cytidylyltransferase family)/predicted dehydrogenase
MKVGYLVTGRLKSTRLPKKLLIEVRGKPVISHMLDRLKLATRIDQIVICTSDLEQDRPLGDIARENGVDCYFGDPDDVLVRLLGAADKYKFDYILNITADCPLVDPDYADSIVEHFEKTDADLIRQFDLPHGAFSYGIKLKALRKVVEIKKSCDTEVWGRYFTDTGLFKVLDLDVVNPFHRRPGLRLTIDYPEDLKVFEMIVEALYKEGEVFSLDQILSFIDANPEVVNLNRHCSAKFKKRFSLQSEIELIKVRKVSKAIIVGSGSIGQRHIRNLKSLGVESIIALRSKKGHHKNLPSELKITEVKEWSEAAKFKPDIAIISNPTSLHLDAIRKVIPFVKGVFIEKPIADSLKGVEDVLRSLLKKNIVSFVGHNLLFHPIIKALSKFISSHEVGGLLNIQCQVGQWLPDWHPYEDYRNAYYARSDLGGGVSRTLIHEIHLITELAGPPVEVCSMLEKSDLLDLDVDVISNVMVRHESGCVSQVHLDYIQKPAHRSGLVTFERGWAAYDFNESRVVAQGENDQAPNIIWSDKDYDNNEMYLEQSRKFLEYVEEGRMKHPFDALGSLDSLRIIEALFESGEGGKFVEVENQVRPFS